MLAHDINDKKKTRDVQITQNITFESMLLSFKTLEGLQLSGFYQPSPVQLKGIPLGKCGFDLMLEAKSGTGKTLVFTIIALEKLDLTKALQTLILTPTREIAAQICDVIKQIGVKYEGLNVESAIGGLPLADDILKFKEKTVHIIVGSPGRVRHLISDKIIDTSSVRLLVLDEADKLTEKSLKKDINDIFKSLPHEKQIIMSSATYPESSKPYLKQYVQSFQHIRPENNNILLGIEQKITIVKYSSNIIIQTKYRYEELLKIFSEKLFKQCLIFCNYQTRVSELYRMLKRSKWPVEQLYGQQDQINRLNALETLKAYKCRILVSTDLAARGIDARNIDLVINFEPPYDWQTYLHRIGRTGRYGSCGVAITVIAEGTEQKKFKKMLVSMKDSLCLTHFWNDHKFNLEITDVTKPQISTPREKKERKDEFHHESTQLEKSITYSNDYTKLWKELTAIRKVDTNIEEFDKLQSSFESTKQVKIESFPDLLKSFQNNVYDSTSLDCSYEYIEWIEPSSKVYSIKEMKLIGKYLDGVDSNNDIQSVEPQNVDGITAEENDAKNYNETNKVEIATTDKDTNSEKINDVNQINISNQTDQVMMKNCNNNGKETKSNSNIDKEDLLSEDMSSDLQALGLPTSFQSTKYSDRVSKTSQTERQVSITSKRYDERKISKHTENNELFQETQQMPSKLRVEGKIKNSKRNEISHLRNTNKIFSYGTTASPPVNLNKSDMKQYVLKSKNSGDSETDESEDDDTSCKTRDYFHWYRQLKYAMKQIELATYIEEMSKMY